MVSRKPERTLGKRMFCVIVKEMVGSVLEGRTVMAGVRAFENHWENNVFVSLAPIPMMPPAGPCPRITRFSKTLEIPWENKLLRHRRINFMFMGFQNYQEILRFPYLQR